MHSYHTWHLYFRLRYRFRIESSESRLVVICKRLDSTVELSVTMKRTPALFVALIMRKQTRQSSRFNSVEFIVYYVTNNRNSFHETLLFNIKNVYCE